MTGHPSIHILAMGALLVGPLMAGCLTPDEGGTQILLPSPPAQMEGLYHFFGDHATLNVTFSMIPAATPEGSPGASETGPVIHVQIQDVERYGGRTFHRLQAFASPQRLSNVTVWCTSPEEDPCGPQGTDWMIVRDALDAPAFFGLGPFLDERLTEGDERTVGTWDPSTPFNVTWTAHAGPRWDDRACLWLEAPRPATVKTPLPLAPFWGRLLACDGLPVPARIEIGNEAFQLADITASSERLPDSPQKTTPPPLDPTCLIKFPGTDDQTLNLEDYMDWAREEDEGVQAWFRDHPEGRWMPGYGWTQQREGLFLYESYPVSADLALYDPESRRFDVLDARQEVEKTPLGTERSMAQSSPIAGAESRVAIADPRPLTCTVDPQPAEPVVERLLETMNFDVRDFAVSLAPDAGSSLQGTGRTLAPFHLVDEARDLYPDPWPARLYVSVAPDGGFVVFIQNGVIDPLTGWVRWHEFQPQTS